MKVGDLVRKPKGYAFPGYVRATFTRGDGEHRLVVEHSTSPGLLHIFSPEQLELIQPGRPTEIPENEMSACTKCGALT